jgi:hypothetical protein
MKWSLIPELSTTPIYVNMPYLLRINFSHTRSTWDNVHLSCLLTLLADTATATACSALNQQYLCIRKQLFCSSLQFPSHVMCVCIKASSSSLSHTILSKHDCRSCAKEECAEILVLVARSRILWADQLLGFCASNTHEFWVRRNSAPHLTKKKLQARWHFNEKFLKFPAPVVTFTDPFTHYGHWRTTLNHTQATILKKFKKTSMAI